MDPDYFGPPALCQKYLKPTIQRSCIPNVSDPVNDEQHSYGTWMKLDHLQMIYIGSLVYLSMVIPIAYGYLSLPHFSKEKTSVTPSAVRDTAAASQTSHWQKLTHASHRTVELRLYRSTGAFGILFEGFLFGHRNWGYPLRLQETKILLWKITIFHRQINSQQAIFHSKLSAITRGYIDINLLYEMASDCLAEVSLTNAAEEYLGIVSNRREEVPTNDQFKTGRM